MELFQNWLAAPRATAEAVSKAIPAETAAAPRLAITRPYVKPIMTHDMESIRAAIAALQKGKVPSSHETGLSNAGYDLEGLRTGKKGAASQ